MEYPGTCHSVKKAEILAKVLVQYDMAEVVKDWRGIDNKVRITVYQIFVGDDLIPINVRFWYDYRYDKACWKMTEEGWEAIWQSATVVAGLMKLGKSVSKNGNGFNMNELDDLLKVILKKLEAEKVIKDEL